MDLQFEMSSLEGASEEVKGLYKKNEETGKFVLGIKGAASKTKLEEFRDNNIQLKRDFETLTSDKLSLTEQLSTLSTKMEGATDKEAVEEQIRSRIEALTAKHTDAMQAKDILLAEASASHTDLLYQTEVTRAAAANGAKPGAIEDIESRVRRVFSVVDGKLVGAGPDGKPLYDSSATNLLSVGEWMNTSLRESAVHLFKDSVETSKLNHSPSSSINTTMKNGSSKISAGLSAHLGR